MVDRIGIIGDVHAEHEHLARALQYLQRQGVDMLVCTGDLMDGPGDITQCVALLRAHQVRTVRGNHDRWVLENKARHVHNAHHLNDLSPCVVDYLRRLPRQLEVNTSHGKLLLCHGVGSNDLSKIWPGTQRMPAERSTRLDKIIASNEYALMINGHMHYRTIIYFDQLTLINAGTLKGGHHPGFSLMDLSQNSITSYELTPEIQAVKTQQVLPAKQARVFKNTQHFDDDWEPVTLYA